MYKAQPSTWELINCTTKWCKYEHAHNLFIMMYTDETVTYLIRATLFQVPLNLVFWDLN